MLTNFICLQDADSQVRDACCDALAAYAQALANVQGCMLPGSMSTPIVRVIFDCLAEQKREGQAGASQALLRVSQQPLGDSVDYQGAAVVKCCMLHATHTAVTWASDQHTVVMGSKSRRGGCSSQCVRCSVRCSQSLPSSPCAAPATRFSYLLTAWLWQHYCTSTVLLWL